MHGTSSTTAIPTAPRWALPLIVPSLADWIMMVYCAVMMLALARVPSGPERDTELRYITLVGSLYAAVVFGFRLLADGRLRGGRTAWPLIVAYRLICLPAILLIYFRLRAVLPMLNGANYDEALFRLDASLFGVEPTLALEPHLGRATVEWFSFFYYSYFFFMAAFALPIAALERNERRAQQFAATFLLVACVGQLLYIAVPGFGPYKHLAAVYQRPLEGGFFYNLVITAVAAGGPLRDIFPSLHTAIPTTLTLFAWRHYRRFALPATFWTVNIIAATIVLRWHWAIDVVAGLALAVTSVVLTPRLVDAWQRVRARFGMAPGAYW